MKQMKDAAALQDTRMEQTTHCFHTNNTAHLQQKRQLFEKIKSRDAVLVHVLNICCTHDEVKNFNNIQSRSCLNSDLQYVRAALAQSISKNSASKFRDNREHYRY